MRIFLQLVCLQWSQIRVSVSSAFDVYSGQGCGILSLIIHHAVSCIPPSKQPAKISAFPGCNCLHRYFI